jgi:hypothetical protein
VLSGGTSAKSSVQAVGVAVGVESGVVVVGGVSVDVAVSCTALGVRVGLAEGEAMPVAAGVLVSAGVAVLVESGAVGVFVGVGEDGVTVEQGAPIPLYNSASG